MSAPRLEISPRLREHMQYTKFAGPSPRIFVLESDYWLDKACLRAAERKGWEVERVPVVLEGALGRDALQQLLEKLLFFRPDFILSINASGVDEDGLLTNLFADLEIPWVTWFVDDPRTILLNRPRYGTPWSVALTWESAYEDSLRACGFGEVYTVPLGVDESLFNHPPMEECPVPPTFIANTMTQQAAREWDWLRQRPHVAEAVAGAFTEGRVTRANFGQGLSAMVGEACHTWDEHEQRHAEIYCFVEGTRRLRWSLAETLAPRGIALAGDDAWQMLSPLAMPYINYSLELPNYYRHCSVNLNSTSIQMPTAVNQRVLDCPAAGGFLLTDAQPQLEALFDVEQEIAVYHDVHEALELMLHYRAHPAERFAMATRARHRVLHEHTYGHRLAHIVSLLKSRFG
jgi:spore maturation protein CgeB